MLKWVVWIGAFLLMSLIVGADYIVRYRKDLL